MSINREAIHLGIYALLQKLEESGELRTLTRKLQHPQDVHPEQMPYCAMVARSQRRTQKQHTPGQYYLPVDLYVYVARKGDDIEAATALNQTLDAIDRALERPHNHPAQDLEVPGVIRCWIEGEITTDEGTLGDIAAAVIPIEVLAAG